MKNRLTLAVGMAALIASTFAPSAMTNAHASNQDNSATSAARDAQLRNPRKFDYRVDQHYRRLVRQHGISGVTRVRASVDSKGNVEKCEVIQSTGNILADNAALALCNTYAEFDPGLDENGKPVGAVAIFRFAPE